jgi:hypothetical protein
MTITHFDLFHPTAVAMSKTSPGHREQPVLTSTGCFI